MNGDYILDSNIVINIFRGDKHTINKVRNISKIFVPIIVLGELYFGAEKSQKTQLRVQQVKQFAKTISVLFVNEETSHIYGKIKSQLKSKGTPIPENDIWIAAITEQNNLPLLSNDKHFKLIDNLNVKSLI